MRIFAWTCALVAVVAAGGCRSSPPVNATLTDGERDLIERRVRRYFKKAVDLPKDVTLDLLNLAPTDVPGLLRAELEIANAVSRRRVPLVVSRDARFLIQGTMADLTVDPHAAAMSQITLDQRPARGNPAAAVTLVAFVDYQCPFSARAFTSLVETVLPAYGDRVRVVIKNFPLATVHPWAEAAAVATICARTVDETAFWSLAKTLFAEQEDLTVDRLRDRAVAHFDARGRDTAAFIACLDADSALEQVRADENEGRSLGVRSTPTYFVNGRKLEGARPFEDIAAALDNAIAAAGAPPPGALQ